MTHPQQTEHPGIGPSRRRLEGKVAIVTGANRGIGRATARLMAHEGAAVVCVDRDESFAPRVDGLIASDGGRAMFLAGDATTRETCEEMVQLAEQSYGTVDILFNNIGGGGKRGRIHEITDTDWQGVLRLTLDSTFNGTRAVLPLFLRQGHGVIVNNASTFGLLAGTERPAYCAAKAAVVNLTRQLALDYGPTVRVNCVCPGATDTTAMSGRTEEQRRASASLNRALGRLARPEEVAYAVLFLASDEASFVTGHALAVDGGQTIDA